MFVCAFNFSLVWVLEHKTHARRSLDWFGLVLELENGRSPIPLIHNPKGFLSSRSRSHEEPDWLGVFLSGQWVWLWAQVYLSHCGSQIVNNAQQSGWGVRGGEGHSRAAGMTTDLLHGLREGKRLEGAQRREPYIWEYMCSSEHVQHLCGYQHAH